MIGSKTTFTDKVVAVTGGANGIGKCICEEFEKRGAKVCIFDIKENPYFVGDLADDKALVAFYEKVIKDYGHIDYLINNAKPMTKGIDECEYEEFNYSLRVGISGPFYLTKLFTPHFSKDGCIVNISSTRDRMSQAFTESYSSAKGGISALTHALAISLTGKVRVNSVSPGWIDTENKEHSESDKAQHPSGRVGNPLDVSNTVLFLCSPKASFINGENICVDGGMSHKMIYHEDEGWFLNFKF